MSSISILGAGYIGLVNSACLSEMGHNVLVADVNADKTMLIAQGQSPIIEDGLDDLLSDGVRQGRLRATNDIRQAVLDTDSSIVCVGTPSCEDGSLDLQYIRVVCQTVGGAIKDKQNRHTVIIRSTMVPGTMNNVVIPVLEKASGLKAFDDFGLAIYPEFLREGAAIRDFYGAAITLFGVRDDQSLAVMREINAGLNSREVVTSLESAEAIKYANNCWHAVKITFANEIGNICRAAGIDGTEVMDIVCEDDRLNISKAYMKPGFAFGGSCLPKDLRAIRSLAAEMEVPTPLFDATLEANRLQVENAAKLVEKTGARKILQLGLAFKDGTDDLRESPLISLGNTLIERGYDISFYDSRIEEALERDEFRQHFETAFPAIAARFTRDAPGEYQEVDAIIAGRKDAGAANLLGAAPGEKQVVDLVRLSPELRSGGEYQGICW